MLVVILIGFVMAPGFVHLLLTKFLFFFLNSLNDVCAFKVVIGIFVFLVIREKDIAFRTAHGYIPCGTKFLRQFNFADR